MATTPTPTITKQLAISIPPEFMQLIANLNTAVVRWNALADDAKAALNAIKAAADAGTQAVPAIQRDVQQAALAVTAFHIQGKGPFGSEISGGGAS